MQGRWWEPSGLATPLPPAGGWRAQAHPEPETSLSLPPRNRLWETAVTLQADDQDIFPVLRSLTSVCGGLPLPRVESSS